MAPQQKTLKNGAIMTMQNGKWKMTSGASKEYMSKIRSMRGSKPPAEVSLTTAKRAFDKYYAEKEYKTERGRKAAITRALCSDNKPVDKTRKFVRSPHRYQYPGVNDGAACPEGKEVRGKITAKKPSAKQLAARSKFTAGVRSGAFKKK